MNSANKSSGNSLSSERYRAFIENISDGVYEITKPDRTLWNYQEFVELLVAASQREHSTVADIYGHVKGVRGSDDLEDDFSMIRVTFT